MLSASTPTITKLESAIRVLIDDSLLFDPLPSPRWARDANPLGSYLQALLTASIIIAQWQSHVEAIQWEGLEIFGPTSRA
jgi:hypothetical protein